MSRLVGITYDEIQTVADIARELIHRGDVRGYTLKTLVEEYAQSTATFDLHDDGYSVRVPTTPRFNVVPFPGSAA